MAERCNPMQHMNRRDRRRMLKRERRAQLRIQREHEKAAGAELPGAEVATKVEKRIRRGNRDRTDLLMEFGLATGAEVALYLGVHVKTVERWRKGLGLPCMKLGGRIRYRLQDVAYWASARKEGE